ncbi:hypothetical protein OHB26_01635 [Nocardia sp. NBC_01503]|uniref:hypothetical protein n=1 Tax=Nocardia sp. NBC_01503 TaxID=2975997 RepID=UPI002E7BFC5C|nr:hypothetical protein [Nocardia sp. NBC_01503]WTL32987.1 hypothetical protein OHB26_01635 [Nocardia sp. NBC_01503]
MQYHRSTSTLRRVSLTVAQVIGATAAATITAGTAAAESLSREDGARDNTPSAPGRSAPPHMGGTGMHAIDPNGYHHTDSNPLLRNQHQQYLREMRATPTEPQRTMPGDDNPTTWNTNENPDGSWTVCRAQASWC